MDVINTYQNEINSRKRFDNGIDKYLLLLNVRIHIYHIIIHTSVYLCIFLNSQLLSVMIISIMPET